jgi:rubrerythrin
MPKTLDNLQAAFAGESQANRRYLAFAKKADEEGYAQVARLFRAAAHAETVHALAHFRAMDGAKTTGENLITAIAGEHYENTTMYPEFVATAEEEGNKRALASFKNALAVEKEHEALYQEAFDLLGKDASAYDYYVCPICGHVEKGSAPDKCPVCGCPGAKFELIK